MLQCSIFFFFFNFHYRLAWDFSVGQLSSKVLKSSQLVSSSVFTERETCDWMCVTNVPSIVGYMFGWSGPESAAVWRCELARHEARLFVPECEDTYSRAARGTISQPTPAASISQKEYSWWWANTKYNLWNVKMIIRIIEQTSVLTALTKCPPCWDVRRIEDVRFYCKSTRQH